MNAQEIIRRVVGMTNNPEKVDLEAFKKWHDEFMKKFTSSVHRVDRDWDDDETSEV